MPCGSTTAVAGRGDLLDEPAERLDELQGVVAELRQMCALGDVVQSRQVLEVLARHRAIA